MALRVQPNPNPRPAEERAAILADPGFGRYFTDHLVRIEYADGAWGEGAVLPYGPLDFDPATMVAHYGQEIFEGLKAYRQADGSVAGFRPGANAARFRRSARRMGMAELPEERFVESLEALVAMDVDWVPAGGGEQSLYLRPFMIATEVGLGVRPANRYLYLLIASPAGPYFHGDEGGDGTVTVWISTEYFRAAPGGTGEVKCGGNYAASILAQAMAAERGCDQVLWLDPVQQRWIEEMGSNNVYFVYGRGENARVMTPALSGTFLPGITRDSLLTVAADLGYPVSEDRISVEELHAGAESGEITEMFGCGTAAIVTPIGRVRSARGESLIGDGTPGDVTMRLREQLLGIQTGRLADRHGWLHRLA
ncbi:MAG: branched-chain amino acid aminotransferase [Actinomycetia bacterium]|nr:branched-chain amino acid aminotransferase [Actinomycetes bacterium]